MRRANPKEQKISIKLNLIMNIILTMSSFLFPLITFPYVSRILLPEGNGKIQLATSFINYFLLLSQLGIPTYGIRVCAAVRDDRKRLSKVVHELCIIQVFMTIVSYAILLTCINLMPQLRQEKSLYLITSITILLTSIGMEWLFKAMEQYVYITIRSLVFKVISVVAMFLLIHAPEDYLIYASISVLANAGSYLMNFIHVYQYIDWTYQGSYDLKIHIKPIFVLFAYTCATTIYTNIDSVMLGFMTTNTEVGYYGVAVKIKNILVSVITALGAVMLPRVSYYYENGKIKEFWSAISKSMKFVLMISLPLMFYFFAFSENVIIFLAGVEYVNAINPMCCIMPTIVLIGITYVLGVQILIPMGKENIVLIASVIAAVADVIINALLIPTMKSTGVAIGTLVAETIVLIFQSFVLRKQVCYIWRGSGFVLKLLACVLASGCSLWVARLEMSHIGVLIISALLFFGIYFLVLHIGRDVLVRDIEKQAKEYIYRIFRVKNVKIK